MPITSSFVSEDLAKKDNRRLVLFRATDNAGRHYMQHEFIGLVDDRDVRLASWVSSLNKKLVESELIELVESARRGEDVTVKPLFDVTREQGIRYVFKNLLPSENPRDTTRLLPIRDWLRANHTPAQIRSILGVTTDRLNSLNSRLDAIAPAKDMIMSDKPDEL